MKQKYSALLNILAEDIKCLYENRTAKDVKKEKIIKQVQINTNSEGKHEYK